MALPIREWLEKDTSLDQETLRQRVQAAFKDAYAQKAQVRRMMRQFEKPSCCKPWIRAGANIWQR